MMEAHQADKKVEDSGRKPIRDSPLLENSKLARLLRDITSGDIGLCRLASARFRDLAAKGTPISEAFPAFRIAICCGDASTTNNLLWAIRYAKRNGEDTSALRSAIEELRNSADTTTRGLAALALESTTPSAE